MKRKKSFFGVGSLIGLEIFGKNTMMMWWGIRIFYIAFLAIIKYTAWAYYFMIKFMIWIYVATYKYVLKPIGKGTMRLFLKIKDEKRYKRWWFWVIVGAIIFYVIGIYTM